MTAAMIVVALLVAGIFVAIVVLDYRSNKDF
jgi:hypothetical protein